MKRLIEWIRFKIFSVRVREVHIIDEELEMLVSMPTGYIKKMEKQSKKQKKPKKKYLKYWKKMPDGSTREVCVEEQANPKA